MRNRTSLQFSPGAAGRILGSARDLDWQDGALCAEVDPGIFFPEKGGSVALPKRICQGCEIRVPCLEYALDNGERFGIWGGLSERERHRAALKIAAGRSIADIIAADDEKACQRAEAEAAWPGFMAAEHQRRRALAGREQAAKAA